MTAFNFPDPGQVQTRLEHSLKRAERTRDDHLEQVLRVHHSIPSTLKEDNLVSSISLDTMKQRRLSGLVRDHDFSLTRLVELVRGQTKIDGRPNKALCPQRYGRLLQGYPHLSLMQGIAKDGIQPTWHSEITTTNVAPANHHSAGRHINAVVGSIRNGQDACQYLVLDEDILGQLGMVNLSPFGAVLKKDADPSKEVRLIHDLSFPRGRSTNDASDKAAFPSVNYKPVATIARRIDECELQHPGVKICLQKGDVKGAFRHLMLASRSVRWMGGRLPERGGLVLDMAAPFGWSGSPPYYAVFGGAISELVSRESPRSLSAGVLSDNEPFFPFEWVDDHVLVVADTPGRLEAADTALRLAMLGVLGPRAINEKKFSSWNTRLEVLGLLFDTVEMTISMPTAKLQKAHGRVVAIGASSTITRRDLERLLGSLRHVFGMYSGTTPRSIPASESLYRDLEWLRCILLRGEWQGLPIRMFWSDPDPDVHLYMDASDQGLAVLDPGRHRYFLVRFDASERDVISTETVPGFSINVRELFCIALAAIIWGPEWRPHRRSSMTYVRAWSDNSSAVSWAQRLHSDNLLAQELTRAIGLSEATHRFRISAMHLPGVHNTVADADTSAPGSEETLQDVLVSLQTRALADSSHRKYAATWKEGNSWCAATGVSPWLTGNNYAESSQLIAYAVWCWQPHHGSLGNAASTILSKLGQISWYYRRFCGFPVGLHPGHQLAMQGMSRLSPPPRRKRPVSALLLRRLRASCDFNSAQDRVLWGATVLGFFFLLRRSEYLADHGSQKTYILRRRDVTFWTREGNMATSVHTAHTVQIRLSGSKTDQRGEGATRSLEQTRSQWLCPVKGAWALAEHGKAISRPDDSPLCAVDETRNLSAEDVSAALKRAAHDIGEEPSEYGTHSLRSGGATAMFAEGVDRLAIKHFGRWSSDCYEQYARMDGTTLRSMADKMVRGVGEQPLRR